MFVKKSLILLIAVTLSGCAANSGPSSRTSVNAGYCPAGTVKVCTSLFELSKERSPSCSCSELITRR